MPGINSNDGKSFSTVSLKWEPVQNIIGVWLEEGFSKMYTIILIHKCSEVCLQGSNNRVNEHATYDTHTYTF